MKVRELIKWLRHFPSDARVILVEELGTLELESSNISFDEMEFVEFPSGHYPPMWQYHSEYDRKILKTEKVVVISG